MSAFDGVHGTVCNETEYTLSQAFRQAFRQKERDYSGPAISCLSPGERIGLVLAAQASFISAISVIVILIWFGWNIRWYRKTYPKGDWKIFQGPSDIYMLALFVFDFMIGMGSILDVRWAQKGITTAGHYCTAQGVIQQFGEVGVALIIFFLAVHTFVAALWKVGLQARGVALGMVCFAFLFTTLWVAIGPSVNHKNYEIPSPYWCWIGSGYTSIQEGGEYVWLWIALVASTILYFPLYFWAKGRLSVDETIWYKFHVKELDPNKRVGNPQRRAALGMLVYPVAYGLLVIPLSVVRWLGFQNHNVSAAVTFFGAILFDLSGAVNVLLFLTFKPNVLLFHHPKTAESEDTELEGQDTRSVFSDIANLRDSPEPPSPEPTSATLLAGEAEGSRNGAAHVDGSD